MSSHGAAPRPRPTVTIRVSGKLFQAHLSYLEQLVQSADECQLWPLLNLEHLEELDSLSLESSQEAGICAHCSDTPREIPRSPSRLAPARRG